MQCTKTRGVVDERLNDNLGPFKYLEYIWDEVWARVDKLRHTARTLRDIILDHIARLTVSMLLHQFDNRKRTIPIAVLMDANPSLTVENSTVGIVDGRFLIKQGVLYVVLDKSHHRSVVADVSKSSDSKLDWTRDSVSD